MQAGERRYKRRQSKKDEMMKQTLYSAEISNDHGKQLTGRGFRNGWEAQRWALEMMPDASKLVLRVRQGQSRGMYVRRGGTGEWQDLHGFGRNA
jgi:hypothetical protein